MKLPNNSNIYNYSKPVFLFIDKNTGSFLHTCYNYVRIVWRQSEPSCFFASTSVGAFFCRFLGDQNSKCSVIIKKEGG